MTGATAISASDHHSRLINDLCTVVVTLITPTRASHVPSRVEDSSRESHVTPGAIVSLLFGASFAMMICGSVTFVLGFMLMPWVIGFVMLLCFAGFVSYLGFIWRGVFGTTQKQLPGQFFSKLPVI
ncbi:hypothetical protein LUZ61_017773 [Rhynchospora tenuis]|uniref:Transmembrane protein n=1 Tax=Rhynchospora tenuis TaxID=198213 RepID=A0AAD6ELB5_9POAL|nr:hypothetical protein LUZ61_017773 [Rhynchospora tenuis]